MVNLVNLVYGSMRVINIYIINNKYIIIYLFTVLPLLVIPQANLQMTKITIYFFYPPQIFHGFILWKEEKVVHLRYLNLKPKYDFNCPNI